MPGYDSVAAFYDQLARLVFGRVFIHTQRFLAGHISPGTDVLIVGGGTGWILEEIAAIIPSGLRIVYVEASEKMLAKARSCQCGGNPVRFIHAPVQQLIMEQEFDSVLTPFLFDNFNEITARQVFSVIDRALRPGGLWLYCDYNKPSKVWQSLLLRSMYLFFRLLCRIEAREMPPVAQYFAASAYTRIEHRSFMRQFIDAFVYRKPPLSTVKS